MVAQNIITASNAKIASTLPSGLVGVFIGGTNGIGEYTLKAFAKHVSKPQVIFTGRSQEAADRIVTECKSINPEGSYTFIKADTSTIRKVDEVSEEIKRKVQTINVLFLTTGVLDFTSGELLKRDEGALGSMMHIVTYADYLKKRPMGSSSSWHSPTTAASASCSICYRWSRAPNLSAA